MSHVDVDRTLRIETPFGPGALLLVRLSGSDAISAPFAFQLELLAERADLPFAAIVGQPVTVRLATIAGDRAFHGIVSRFVHTGRTGKLFTYRAELRPWTWLLDKSADCRIFQNKSVPEIVEQVFRDRGFADFEFALLQDRHPPLVYCVQYRETDFAFVSRLLEEAGIHYWFEHEPGRHKMVLADGGDAHRPCAGPAVLPFQPFARGAAADEAVIDAALEEQVTTNRIALQDFDFERPSLDLAVQQLDGRGRALERYDYPGRYQDRDAGARLATVRLHGERGCHRLLQGAATARSLQAGRLVTLCQHPRPDVNGSYLLVEVTHDIREPAAYGSGRGGGSGGAPPCQTGFVAVPEDQPLRPRAVTPRPRIHGSQTAIVVGPAGEEIHTDKYGRVKVQFHWDREGQRDEHSSCWVRVAQGWAGKSWGAVFLPRIGQEVVVDFLEGDPDRPLITGRVYNAEQMPPYELPARATVSTLKSRSSPGGGPANFNELRFEDKKGAEEIYIHAERDHNQVTERNRSEDVGNDRSLLVGRDKSERVKRDKRVTVDRDHTERIDNDMRLTVAGSREVKVDKNLTETVQQDQRTSVAGRCELTVDKDYAVTVTEAMTTTVSRDLTCTVDGDSTYETGKDHGIGAKKITLEAEDEIELKVGPASLKLTKTGELTAQAITLSITGAATVTVKGGTILLN